MTTEDEYFQDINHDEIYDIEDEQGEHEYEDMKEANLSKIIEKENEIEALRLEQKALVKIPEDNDNHRYSGYRVRLIAIKHSIIEIQTEIKQLDKFPGS